MRKASISIRIYLGLNIALAILAAVSIFLPAYQGLVSQQLRPTG